MSGNPRLTALAIAGTVTALATAVALSPQPQRRRGGPRAAAAHYRAHGDFESLQRALPELWLGRPQAEVEVLLGDPTYCPLPGEQCYYASEAVNSAGVTLALVVEYRTFRPDTAETTRTGRVESISLGPVAE